MHVADIYHPVEIGLSIGFLSMIGFLWFCLRNYAPEAHHSDPVAGRHGIISYHVLTREGATTLSS